MIQMNLVVLLASAALVSSYGVQLHGGYYRVPANAGTVLMKDVEKPYQLGLDRDTNTLFFSYTVDEQRRREGDDNAFRSAYVNLKDGTSGTIPGVHNGFANAYDTQQKIVYIGGDTGVHKFDYRTKTASNLNITESNIWQMFYKNGLYFTTYPDQKAFVYKNDRLRLVPELMDVKATLVALEKGDSIVYSLDGDLRRTSEGRVYELGSYNVNGFNTDVNGDLYFSTSDAIYQVDGNTVQKFAAFPDIYGFAFEGDKQIIYGTENSVMRLTLTSDMFGDDNKTKDEVSNNVPQ
uniref:Diapause-associated protein n=1 Tax=Ostrinia furnacalis TaxID=93504 RepID=Q9NDA4_OSTFU|nr:diapause-associated protein [Ostrinia furnacalis]